MKIEIQLGDAVERVFRELNRRLRSPMLDATNEELCASRIGAGVTAGLALALVLGVVRYRKYSWGELPPATFGEFLGIVAGIGLPLGIASGWAIHKHASLGEARRAVRAIATVALFTIGGTLMFLAHQIAARDALIRPGAGGEACVDPANPKQSAWMSRCAPDWARTPNLAELSAISIPFGVTFERKVSGPEGSPGIVKFCRPTGGPLGEPDFESLAFALAGGFGLLVVGFSLRRAQVPKPDTIVGIVKDVTVYASAGFGLVVLAYRLLLGLGPVCQHQVLLAPWIFIVDFPHPERWFIVTILSAMWCMVFLVAMRIGALRTRHGES